MTNPIVRSFVASFLVSAILVWAVRLGSIRAGFYDRPGQLKIHKKPIPRLGGLGLTIGFFVGASTALAVDMPGKFYLFGSLILVWLTGLIDDLRGLPPLLRLIIQVIAGLLIFGAFSPLHDKSPILGAATTCLTIVVFVNAFNFLDGSDGLAAGIAAISAIGFAALFGRHDFTLAAIAISLAAACLGFLLFNFPPASIFMGDCGSTVLGLILASLSVRATSEPGRDPFIIILLLIAIPLLDFTFAVIRRLLCGRSVFSGDRSHYYDILLRRGWTPRRIALTSYLLGLFGLAAGFAVRATHV